MGPPIKFRAPSRWRASGPLEVSSKSYNSFTFYEVLKKTNFFLNYRGDEGGLSTHPDKDLVRSGMLPHFMNRNPIKFP